MVTEEERRARLENDAATKCLRLAMETRKARLEKIVATAQLMLALINTEVVITSLIPIDAILPEICAFIVGFS